MFKMKYVIQSSKRFSKSKPYALICQTRAELKKKYEFLAKNISKNEKKILDRKMLLRKWPLIFMAILVLGALKARFSNYTETLIFLILAYIFYRLYLNSICRLLNELYLLKEGVKSTAVVECVDLWRTSRSSFYILKLSFMIDGTRYVKFIRESYLVSCPSLPRVGDHIVIKYEKNNPLNVIFISDGCGEDIMKNLGKRKRKIKVIE